MYSWVEPSTQTSSLVMENLLLSSLLCFLRHHCMECLLPGQVVMIEADLMIKLFQEVVLLATSTKHTIQAHHHSISSPHLSYHQVSFYFSFPSFSVHSLSFLVDHSLSFQLPIWFALFLTSFKFWLIFVL